MIQFFKTLWDVLDPILYIIGNGILNLAKTIIENPWVLILLGVMALLGLLRKAAK